ncbi:MAG: hypothetical protein QOI15_2951 [Pseudonocardiales bacterium]|nr:hypothetical protein [Pseudonocardiales bacterium]
METANDPISDAAARLAGAGLIPPISGLETLGPAGDLVAINVRGHIGDELAARVAQALVGIRYELREVSATHGIDYA